MRVDRDDRLIQQVTVWLPVEMVQLIKADKLNISVFIRDQIALLYSEPAASQNNSRDRLVQATQESLARHRAAQAEHDADVERARAAIRVMRAERDAVKDLQDGIVEALLQVIGENPHNDRLDDWEALVRRVCRLCGAEIDTAEVAAGVRALIAKA